jgi:aspartyl-tRNA(Asn)/glutamyl-tRNA(Gln) amidotransferase subunit A
MTPTGTAEPGLHRRPLAQLVRETCSGRTTAESVLRSSLMDIVNVESGPDRLNAFISWDYEASLERARAVDQALERRGGRMADRGPTLAGVPVAVKDNICTADLPTTCGSRLLAHYRSPYDATVVRRLRDAGAVIVGKTNLDEFAMGSSTENSAFHATRNPHAVECVPGGSSGGSAAAVAAGMVPAALGSDTGGSVRQPASFCGVVGLKPSYGRVSRYGLVAFASSLDQVGVFGRSVADAARLLEVIAGHDPLDPTTATVPVPDLIAAAEAAAPPAVVGVPREFFDESLDPGVRRACEGAIAAWREAGTRVLEVSLPYTNRAVQAYCVIACAEASSNLARFDGARYGARVTGADVDELYERTRAAGFGPEVRRRVLLGTHVLSAGAGRALYAGAQVVRARVADECARVFAGGVDVLFTPTTPTTAFEFGSRPDPWSMYGADVYTVTANLAALPALSLPVGTAAGLPVGGQLMAPRWAESKLVGAAAALEGHLR